MLEKIIKRLRKCNERRLENHFIIEDIDKEILYFGKNLSREEIKERQELLNKRIAKRKNLYIYPAKDNV